MKEFTYRDFEITSLSLENMYTRIACPRPVGKTTLVMQGIVLVSLSLIRLTIIMFYIFTGTFKVPKWIQSVKHYQRSLLM